jgi:EpsD family peptidyl-prolyl cis-trans isomerase
MLAARVNAEPITVQELEAARKRGETLDRLIEQRLARQHAIERGLDRAPQIVRAMEAARTEILEHAYRQLVAEAQPKPTPEEIRRYYAEHPELFAKRRIYSLEEVTIARGREFAKALRERLAKGEPLEAIALWLESLEARFTMSRSTRAAEQLPLELLPRLHKMKEGEVHAIDHGPDGTVVLVRVVAARLSPLDEATAAPLIEKFLLARRSSDALAAELKRLRTAARIEYLAGTP